MLIIPFPEYSKFLFLVSNSPRILVSLFFFYKIFYCQCFPFYRESSRQKYKLGWHFGHVPSTKLHLTRWQCTIAIYTRNFGVWQSPKEFWLLQHSFYTSGFSFIQLLIQKVLSIETRLSSLCKQFIKILYTIKSPSSAIKKTSYKSGGFFWRIGIILLSQCIWNLTW
jgi:hypothetical protein